MVAKKKSAEFRGGEGGVESGSKANLGKSLLMRVRKFKEKGEGKSD